MSFTLRDETRSLLDGDLLTSDEAAWAMGELLGGSADVASAAAFLAALQAVGEGADALEGFLSEYLRHTSPLPCGGEALDIVGTGGDHSGTVNISSMAAIVIAAAGVPVLKHGHRAVHSRSGSADFFAALGVDLDATPEQVAQIFTEIGIGFASAPLYHHDTEWVESLLRRLRIPTVFDVLSPLSNPAEPRAMAVGVAREDRLSPVAEVLARRSVSGLVFRGMDGLDELSTTGPNTILQVCGGEVFETELDPASLGLAPAELEDLVGGDAESNAEIARSVFDGEAGSVRDIVLLNAAGGLVAARLSTDPDSALEPLRERFEEALGTAVKALDSGAAADLLATWVEAFE